MRRILIVCLLLSAAGAAGDTAPARPRAPDGYEAMRPALHAGAAALRATLADALPQSRSLVEVEAGYLAGQGVLVVVDLVEPRFSLGSHRLDLDGEITGLEQVPDMVHDILRELDAGLTRQQARELNDLHRLRAATHVVQARQRALRAERREKRRALEHAKDPETAAALQQDIEQLNEAIDAARTEERSLAQNAASTRDELNTPAPQPAAPVGDAEIGAAVARSVCTSAATFGFLASGQRLDVLVRQPDVSLYYVFAAEGVKACRNGDISPQALLAQSFGYRS